MRTLLLLLLLPLGHQGAPWGEDRRGRGGGCSPAPLARTSEELCCEWMTPFVGAAAAFPPKAGLARWRSHGLGDSLKVDSAQISIAAWPLRWSLVSLVVVEYALFRVSNVCGNPSVLVLELGDRFDSIGVKLSQNRGTSDLTHVKYVPSNCSKRSLHSLLETCLIWSSARLPRPNECRSACRSRVCQKY